MPSPLHLCPPPHQGAPCSINLSPEPGPSEAGIRLSPHRRPRPAPLPHPITLGQPRTLFLTNVVKPPCHFHLIMVMTPGRGALAGENPI